MTQAASPDLTAAQREQLQGLLPWYVNNTLRGDERDWVDAIVSTSEAARRMLAQESVFRSQAAMLVAQPEGDLGLSGLMARIQQDRTQQTAPTAQSQQATSAVSSWPANEAAGSAQLPERRPITHKRAADASPSGSIWQALSQWVDWLTQPRMAAAMAVVLVVQAGVITWQGQNAIHDTERGVAVQELRTLRVRFRDDVPQGEMRKALNAAGARIVAGPNQLGEYWLASDLRSVQEMQSALQAAGVAQQIEPDTLGPDALSPREPRK